MVEVQSSFKVPLLQMDDEHGSRSNRYVRPLFPPPYLSLLIFPVQDGTQIAQIFHMLLDLISSFQLHAKSALHLLYIFTATAKASVLHDLAERAEATLISLLLEILDCLVERRLFGRQSLRRGGDFDSSALDGRFLGI